MTMTKKLDSTTRLEAFSDGVMAVIITIMVLELKVPHENGLGSLYTVMPTLLVYLLSFTFVGIYWVNHDHLLKRIEGTDKVMLYANLFFLFCLSLLPFFTSYVLEKGIDRLSVAIYALSMVLTGFSFFLLRVAIMRNLKYFGKLKFEDMQAQRKHLASLALYVVAAGLADWHPEFAMGVIALVTLIWIVPNLRSPVCEGQASAATRE